MPSIGRIYGTYAAAVAVRHVQGRQERWRRTRVGSAHGIAVRVCSGLKYERYQTSPDVTKIGREPVSRKRYTFLGSKMGLYLHLIMCFIMCKDVDSFEHHISP